MYIGPKDETDKKLVRLYKDTQTVNVCKTTQTNTENLLNSITLLGLNNKIYFEVQRINLLRKSA
jgi:hypothetical protein